VAEGFRTYGSFAEPVFCAATEKPVAVSRKMKNNFNLKGKAGSMAFLKFSYPNIPFSGIQLP
jgi:hypothetical protein